MSNYKGSNRRRNLRLKYPCLIVLKDDQKEDVPVLVQVHNISEGGVAVISKKNFKMLSNVDVDIEVDLDQHIKCQGQIIWSIKRSEEEAYKPLFYDIGITFVDISDQNLKRIVEIVDYYKEKKERDDFFIL